jgi:hypothetical protein
MVGAVVVVAACAPERIHIRRMSATTAAVLTGVVTTAGAARTTASFVASTGPHGAPTCSDAARHGNAPAFTRFVVAMGSGGGVYGGLQVDRYRGPGRYTTTALRMDEVLLTISHDEVEFHRTAGSVVTMTVTADGSGTASFTGYRALDGRPLGGSLHWSCETRVSI